MPLTHFIPVYANLSDVIDQVQWARANVTIVQNIRRSTRQFVMDHLQPLNIYCYHAIVFKVNMIMVVIVYLLYFSIMQN